MNRVLNLLRGNGADNEEGNPFIEGFNDGMNMLLNTYPRPGEQFPALQDSEPSDDEDRNMNFDLNQSEEDADGRQMDDLEMASLESLESSSSSLGSLDERAEDDEEFAVANMAMAQNRELIRIFDGDSDSEHVLDTDDDVDDPDQYIANDNGTDQWLDPTGMTDDDDIFAAMQGVNSSESENELIDFDGSPTAMARRGTAASDGLLFACNGVGMEDAKIKPRLDQNRQKIQWNPTEGANGPALNVLAIVDLRFGKISFEDGAMACERLGITNECSSSSSSSRSSSAMPTKFPRLRNETGEQKFETGWRDVPCSLFAVIASQDQLLVENLRRGQRLGRLTCPARINNVATCNEAGPFGAHLAVTLDNGQVSLIQITNSPITPLVVVKTWKLQEAPCWSLSLTPTAVAVGSNDSIVRRFTFDGDEVQEERFLDHGTRHVGNIPGVVAWDNKIVSAGLDQLLFCWQKNLRRPRHYTSAGESMWAVQRVPKNKLKTIRGTCKVGHFSDRALDFGDVPPDIMICNVLPFLDEDSLLNVGRVKSHWVHKVDEEFASRERKESVLVVLGNHKFYLFDEHLAEHMEVSESLNVFDDNSFAVVSEPYGNKVFIGRKRGTTGLIQLSLFRLFNSKKIGLREDTFKNPKVQATFGLDIVADTLYGLCEDGGLWRANLKASETEDEAEQTPSGGAAVPMSVDDEASGGERDVDMLDGEPEEGADGRGPRTALEGGVLDRGAEDVLRDWQLYRNAPADWMLHARRTFDREQLRMTPEMHAAHLAAAARNAAHRPLALARLRNRAAARNEQPHRQLAWRDAYQLLARELRVAPRAGPDLEPAQAQAQPQP